MAMLEEQDRPGPGWAKGWMWVGLLFATICVWSVFVGCDRMSKTEELQSQLEQVLLETNLWDHSTGPVASSLTQNSGVEFSRYVNLVYAEISLAMTKEERQLVGKKLGLSDETLKKEFSAFQKTKSGGYVDIIRHEGWIDQIRGDRPIYRISISKPVGLLTPFEWLQTLD